MNILIIGIHGFVGSNLVAALKAQHTLYGLDIVSPKKEGVRLPHSASATFATFNWHELEQIPPVDLIIHLARKADNNVFCHYMQKCSN